LEKLEIGQILLLDSKHTGWINNSLLNMIHALVFSMRY
jgi:hypothetical protein